MSEEAKEVRVKSIIQRLDKTNEARGEAIKILNAAKRVAMTPEERQKKAEQDNDALFGMRHEEERRICQYKGLQLEEQH